MVDKNLCGLYAIITNHRQPSNEMGAKKRGRLTLVRIGRSQDGAVLPLHLLHFLCQRLDEAPDLFHLLGRQERQSQSTLDRLPLTWEARFII